MAQGPLEELGTRTFRLSLACQSKKPDSPYSPEVSGETPTTGVRSGSTIGFNFHVFGNLTFPDDVV